MVVDKRNHYSYLICLSTDVLLRIKSYLVAHPEVAQDQTRWIMGTGWDQTNWPGGEFPSAVCAATDFR
jgi:hypothetical protein